MKKIFMVFVVGMFLLNLASASLQDTFIIESSQETIQLTNEECSSIEYKLFSPFLRDFAFEIKTLDTNEQFFMVLREKDCLWYFEILEEIESKADITIIGSVLNEQLVTEDVEFNTLKGKFLGRLIKDEFVGG